jgi:serine/threonine-protein kinase RsbW
LKSDNIHREAKFKSTTKNLGEIRTFINNILLNIKISEEEKDKIILAVDEACTNIIKHAYKLSPNNDILIKVNLNNSELQIRIIDYGESFDPSTVPIPDIKELYREHKVGGLGLHLIRSLMDEVDFNAVPGVQNEVTLKKFLPQAL